MRTIAIREYDAKLVLAYLLERAPAVDPSAKVVTPFIFPSPKVAQISWDPATNAITPDTQLPGWVFSTKLVAKPDQLIKRRGKAGLLALNKSWDEAKEWIQQRAGKPQKVSIRFLSPRRTPSPLLYARLQQPHIWTRSFGVSSSNSPPQYLYRTPSACFRIEYLMHHDASSTRVVREVA